MTIKYVFHGLISLRVNFHENRTIWTVIKKSRMSIIPNHKTVLIWTAEANRSSYFRKLNIQAWFWGMVHASRFLYILIIFKPTTIRYQIRKQCYYSLTNGFGIFCTALLQMDSFLVQ